MMVAKEGGFELLNETLGMAPHFIDTLYPGAHQHVNAYVAQCPVNSDSVLADEVTLAAHAL